MGTKQSIQQKRCVCCGRFFRPSKHVGKRQVCCQRAECQKEWRRRRQAKWRQANPGYFKGRYEYLKEWRKRHPNYQKSWRSRKTGEIQTQAPPVSSMKSIRLNMRVNHPVSEIQMLVLRLLKRGQALWVDGVHMQPG